MEFRGDEAFEIVEAFLAEGLQIVVIDSIPMFEPKSEEDKSLTDPEKMSSSANPLTRIMKREKVVDLECIKEFYGYSNDKAKAALEVLNDVQLNEIKKNLNKGGLNGKSKRVSGGEAI